MRRCPLTYHGSLCQCFDQRLFIQHRIQSYMPTRPLSTSRPSSHVLKHTGRTSVHRSLQNLICNDICVVRRPTYPALYLFGGLDTILLQAHTRPDFWMLGRLCLQVPREAIPCGLSIVFQVVSVARAFFGFMPLLFFVKVGSTGMYGVLSSTGTPNAVTTSFSINLTLVFPRADLSAYRSGGKC